MGLGHGRPLTWAEAHWVLMDEIKEIQVVADPTTATVALIALAVIVVGLVWWKFGDKIKATFRRLKNG